MRGRGKHAYGVRSADMYPGTANCQLYMHTSYRSAHQLLSNTVNSGTDPAEFISHSASPMFELDRQSEFQYSTRSSIWPISTHWHHFVINTILRFDFISTIYDRALAPFTTMHARSILDT